jgi:hypothetical protein
METFAPAQLFVHNPGYRDNCEQAKTALDLNAVDAPIRAIITAFNKLCYCYTLQCCYGHFLHATQSDLHNMERLPGHAVGLVHYRIAYLALCLEDSAPGIHLFSLLEQVPEIGTGYIQFGSPRWFWEQHPNSYALQVEPERFCERDTATIEYPEALRVQNVRDRFFKRLEEIVGKCT